MDHNDIRNFEFLKQYIEKGDVLVDIGANFGDYTKFFHEILGNTGKIYSVELFPSTANQLKQNFSNCENIFVINKAVTNVDGEVNYYKGVDAWTNNIIGHDMAFRENELAGKIESIRIDTLLENEEKIKLLKIDVEGAEKFVLEGIGNSINKIDYILVECHLSQDWDEIKDMIFNKYKLTCIDLENMKKVTENSHKPYQCFCINLNNQN